jgi:hypothetical protein
VRVACGRPVSAEDLATGDPQVLVDRIHAEMVDLQKELHKKRL